jgi:hypothetical protein
LLTQSFTIMLRTFYLSFCFLLCLPFFSQATHLMGGEITARHLSGADYEVKLTTYRDTFGIPMALSVDFELKGPGGNVIQTFTQPQDNGSGGLMPGYPYGVEGYTFTDTLTMPGIGTAYISFVNCCRNGAIQNLAAPLTESMYLETQVSYFGTIANNSTPVFLVEPVIFLPVRTPWQYNPLPFDADGDSLVWSLDTSLTGFGQYVGGYTSPPDTSTNPFTIDPVTGTISWMATQVGNFNASVLVEEYRNGGKIGEIRRDMQFIVVNPGNNRLPGFSNFNNFPRNGAGYPEFTIGTAQGLSLSLLASDPNPQDQITMEAYGEPFLFTQQEASFQVNPTGMGNEIEGIFEWRPDISMVRSDPYVVVFRLRDEEFTFDEAVLFRVENNTAVDAPLDLSIGQVYPNPASSSLFIPLAVEKATELQFQVYNYAGVRVQSLGKAHYPSGQHLIRAELDGLAPGAYFLAIEQDGRMLKAEKFVIAR